MQKNVELIWRASDTWRCISVIELGQSGIQAELCEELASYAKQEISEANYKLSG